MSLPSLSCWPPWLPCHLRAVARERGAGMCAPATTPLNSMDETRMGEEFGGRGHFQMLGGRPPEGDGAECSRGWMAKPQSQFCSVAWDKFPRLFPYASVSSFVTRERHQYGKDCSADFACLRRFETRREHRTDVGCGGPVRTSGMEARPRGGPGPSR